MQQTKEQQVKEFFNKYRFFQNIHFCKLIKIKQPTLKMWLSGKRPLSNESINKLNEFFKKFKKIIKD